MTDPAVPNRPARLGLAAATLLCVLPFLQPYHRYPLTSFYSEWLALACGLGVIAVLMGRRAWSDAEVPWASLPLFALAGWLIVHGAAGWSPYFGQALLGALYLVWAGLLVIAGRALVRACGADAVGTVLAGALVASALLSALVGVIQHFNLITPVNDYITRLHGAAVFGNLAQANHYAALIALGLFSIAQLHSRGRLPLPAAALIALPLLFVLGLSGSRSVWLYLLAGFAWALRLRMAGDDRQTRRLFAWTASFIILHYLLQLAAGYGWLAPAQREAVTAVERLFTGAASVSDRIALWQAALAIAAERPLQGVGWGGFAIAYFQHLAGPAAAGSPGLYNNVHNLPLHLLAETGVIGASLLLLPLAWGLWRALRARPDPAHWWLWATLGVFGLHSLLEYPLWYAYFLGIAALLLGLCPAPALRPRLARFGRLIAASAVLAGAANLLFLWNDYRVFERAVRPTMEQLRDPDFVNTILRIHRNALLTPYVELSMVMPLPASAEDLQRRLALNERVIRFTPQPVLVYRQALLLAFAGRAAEARNLLAAARRAYPAAPAGFEERLAQLAREQPALFRPLLESAHSGPRPPQ
ncbi:MAG: O-antigen ligase C-terminal domain-containing protein [Burkholderiales bacterium]|nr:O-antigen ligase C-terminal domain-containing protein [Burkholderiales bacterium]